MSRANLLVIDATFKELVNTNFFEQIDKETANKFLNSRWRKHNNLDIDTKSIGYLKKYLAQFGSNNSAVVSYVYSKKAKDFGRIYPKEQGLTLLPKVIRNAIIDYIDLDIKNAHPTFGYNLGKLYKID
jgi:hypothetical protein